MAGGSDPHMLEMGGSIRSSIQGALIRFAGTAGSNRNGFPSLGRRA
jgi:hypothetical protein